MKQLSSNVLAAEAEHDHEHQPAPSPIERWVVNNGRNFLIGIAIAGTLLIVGFRYYSGQRVGAEHDYLSAAMQFDRVQAGSKLDNDALESLNAIMTRHPELATKYEGQIAHALIKSGDYAGATDLGQQVLLRVGGQLPETHSSFAQTTLLICNGQLTEALSATKELNQTLTGKTSLDEQEVALHTFNLVRLGMLHQSLGLAGEEEAAWDQVDEWTRSVKQGRSRKSQRIVAEALSTFQEGSVSLDDYIAQRRQALTQ